MQFVEIGPSTDGMSEGAHLQNTRYISSVEVKENENDHGAAVIIEIADHVNARQVVEKFPEASDAYDRYAELASELRE